MYATPFLVPTIQNKLQTITKSNPEGTPGMAMAAAAMAISGALQGGLVGAVMSETPWYDGLWKGALAGAGASALLGIMLSLAAGEGTVVYAEGTGMCPSWGGIAKSMFAIGVLSSINGFAAGAAVGDGHRGRTAGTSALWAAGIFAAVNGLFDVTEKVMPRSACATV